MTKRLRSVWPIGLWTQWLYYRLQERDLSGFGVRVRRLPATPERILELLDARQVAKTV